MRAKEAGRWKIRLPGVSDVITLSRTMSHLWVNHTTATVFCLSSSVRDITPLKKPNTHHLGPHFTS